ncbi:hypothetical protein uc509_0059 [Lactococcus cremoris subsp. cremoris UC509.9]|nr:hypothetical protein uc509_0059 [Lactococcus cremoris subsp. cremoris UC509.9]MRM68771.1 hypothetical protein [Lactococcus cremoris]QJD19086.1 hypothetical protein HG420_03265 [Lactococcus cremoris]QRZ28895.1 hypothetical protein LLB26_0055 [Lactococcus cremoris]
MKKTYFIKIFNLVLNLIFLTLFESFFSFVFKLLVFTFDKNTTLSKISFFIQIEKWTALISDDFKYLAIATLILVLLLIVKEAISRLLKDSLLNFFKSIFQTFKLRHFLVQNESSEKTVENQKVTSFNPIFKNFNKAVHKCVIDVTNENIIVFIKVPHTQQAQKLLKDMESQIKEEIASRNPDYYFSTPNRVKNKMWFIGTKR